MKTALSNNIIQIRKQICAKCIVQQMNYGFICNIDKNS